MFVGIPILKSLRDCSGYAALFVWKLTMTYHLRLELLVHSIW